MQDTLVVRTRLVLGLAGVSLRRRPGVQPAPHIPVSHDGRPCLIVHYPRQPLVVSFFVLCLILSEDGDEGAAAVDGTDEDSKLSQAELDKVAVSLSLSGTTIYVGSYVQ